MANSLTSSTGVVTGTANVSFDITRTPGKAVLLATYALGTLGTSASLAMSYKNTDFGTSAYTLANAEYGTYANKAIVLNASGSFVFPLTISKGMRQFIIDVSYTGGSNAQTLALDLLSE